MSPEISQGQDMRASTRERFAARFEAGGGGTFGTSGTRITWKEYEPYSFGTGTLIRFRRGRAIVSMGGMAANFRGSMRGGVPRGRCG